MVFGALRVLMPPMMAVIRLLQRHVGWPTAVVLAWPVFLTGLWLWHRGDKVPVVFSGLMPAEQR
jgi:hypothetical protein